MQKAAGEVLAKQSNFDFTLETVGSFCFTGKVDGDGFYQV